MDNFDFRKYIYNNPLLNEEISNEKLEIYNKISKKEFGKMYNELDPNKQEWVRIEKVMQSIDEYDVSPHSSKYRDPGAEDMEMEDGITDKD